MLIYLTLPDDRFQMLASCEWNCSAWHQVSNDVGEQEMELPGQAHHPFYGMLFAKRFVSMSRGHFQLCSDERTGWHWPTRYCKPLRICVTPTQHRILCATGDTCLGCICCWCRDVWCGPMQHDPDMQPGSVIRDISCAVALGQKGLASLLPYRLAGYINLFDTSCSPLLFWQSHICKWACTITHRSALALPTGWIACGPEGLQS